jgi:hypothetical protein
LVSDINLGSDYFSYIFDGQANIGLLENNMAAYINSAIPSLTNVKVNVQYASDTVFQFLIYFSTSDGIIKQSNTSTFIEVEL